MAPSINITPTTWRRNNALPEDQLALAENTRMLVTQLIELYQIINK